MDLVLGHVLVGLALAVLFSLKLPPELVVGPIVEKLAAVSKPAEPRLLVVFAKIRRVVPANGGSDVGRSPNRSFTDIRTTGISLSRVFFLVVLSVIGQSPVDFVVSFTLQFLLN